MGSAQTLCETQWLPGKKAQESPGQGLLVTENLNNKTSPCIPFPSLTMAHFRLRVRWVSACYHLRVSLDLAVTTAVAESQDGPHVLLMVSLTQGGKKARTRKEG